jgi:hypothetical protein
MQNSLVLSLLAVCIGLSTAATVHAADVAVFAPEASNLSPQDASAVGELIAQSYAVISRQTVLSPARAEAALAQTHAYEAAAAQLAVREFIRMSAVAAGRRIVITAARYQADGRMLQQVRQLAESIEDVALASDSVARALLTGAMPVAAPAPAAAPPPFQPRPPKEDNMVYGFKAGLHMPFARDASYYPAVSLQFDGRLQLSRMFLEFGAGFVLPTVIRDTPYESCTWNNATQMSICTEPPSSNRGHVGGFTAEIGASRYLTDGDVALYIGGGIIMRFIIAGLGSYDDDGVNERNIASILGYGQFGLTFPRHNTTRFFADLRVSQAFLSQRLENGKNVWPVEPTLHVGFGW